VLSVHHPVLVPAVAAAVLTQIAVPLCTLSISEALVRVRWASPSGPLVYGGVLTMFRLWVVHC
jgi:hypothetical protein